MLRSLLITLTLILTLSAQTVEEAVNLVQNENGFGVKASAMGNAFTGIADDYSAIYWNPAGLAQLKKQQIYSSMNHLKLKTEATYLGNKSSINQGFTKFNSFGYVYPMPVTRGSMVFALDYQRIKDLNHVLQYAGFNPNSNDLGFSIYNNLGYNGLFLPFDLDLNISQNIREEGHLSHWSFAGAIALAPNFTAGVAVNIIGGSSDYRLKYRQEDAKGTNSYDIELNGQIVENFYYNYYQIEQLITTDYSGLEIKVGGLTQVNDNLQLGGTITFPINFSIDESWTFADELSYDIYSIANDMTYHFIDPYDSVGTFSYELQIPFKFDVGLSYTLKNLLLAASARYVDWTQFKLKKGDNTPAWYSTYFTKQNDLVPLILKDVFSYSLGIQYSLFKNRFQLRAGYRYVPSPIKVVDKKTDKKYYSFGMGFRTGENTQIDLAWIHGYNEAIKYYRYDWDNNQTLEPMTTKEKYFSDRIQFGLRYNF